MDIRTTHRMILVLGMMAFFCNGDNYAAAPLIVEIRTGYNILFVGLILSCFGLATVLGGRIVGVLRQKMGSSLFLIAGTLACVSWGLMGAAHSPFILAVCLTGFGFGTIMIHPTLVATAQQLMPKRRGTVMSLASFAMFTGGGLGAYLNGELLTVWGFEPVFVIAGVLILVAGISAAALLRPAWSTPLRSPATVISRAPATPASSMMQRTRF